MIARADQLLRASRKAPTQAMFAAREDRPEVDGSLEDDLPSEQHKAGMRPKYIFAVAAGNSIAVYDFLIYSFFAAQIGRTFFPSTDSAASLLASLAAFGAGFAARPLGAVVIGRLGDRLGRTLAMQLSFLLMGGAMIGMAVMPSYSMIGTAAPALVVLLRLVQGFALGGELGPSTAYLLEMAPTNRRGLFVAVQYLSQDMAILAAGLVGFTLALYLQAPALDSWGWRLAFAAGGVIVPLGYYLRRSLPETLGVATATATAAANRADGPRPLRRVVTLTTIVLAGSAVVTYVQIYLATYATFTLGLPARLAFLSTITMGICGLVFSPIGGWLSDRYGRRPVMIGPWLVLLIAGLPGFQMLARAGTTTMLVAWTAVIASCAALAITSTLTAIAESLPPSGRSGGLGLIYALAVAIFGGSTQFVVAWLTVATGSPLAPGWYMAGAAAAAFVAMLLMPETAPLAERRAAR